MISDYSKYKNHGWGLSKLAFEKLSNIMSIIIKESKNIYGLKELVPSILLVEDLSRTNN